MGLGVHAVWCSRNVGCWRTCLPVSVLLTCQQGASCCLLFLTLSLSLFFFACWRVVRVFFFAAVVVAFQNSCGLLAYACCVVRHLCRCLPALRPSPFFLFCRSFFCVFRGGGGPPRTTGHHVSSFGVHCGLFFFFLLPLLEWWWRWWLLVRTHKLRMITGGSKSPS
jgi:hypothetical protein